MGEVFTPQEICNTLIGMSRYCKFNRNYKDYIEFCDTSCGIGNIIIRFLDDRFNYCEDEWDVMKLINHIHGYDIDENNVQECKRRIFEWTKNSILVFTDSFIWEKVIKEWLDKVIICADYLNTEIINKFDLIIQNPPYVRGLYLDFLEKAYNDINEDGEIVSIQPSTWLINLHESSKQKHYRKIQSIYSCGITDVIIENYNNEFDTGLYVPYSIIHFDRKKKQDHINAEVIGEHFDIHDLNDINLIDSSIGSKEIIYNIISKCQINKESMMPAYIWDKKTYNDTSYFVKYLKVIGRSFCGDPRVTDGWYENNLLSPPCYYAIADKRAGISKTPHYQLANGRTYKNPEFTNILSDQLVFDNKDDAQNFVDNVYNCDIYPFLAICFNYNMANQVFHYVPVFCYSKYFEDDIFKMLNLTDDEISLIKKTILKYNRNSNWYRRLQFGVDWQEHFKTKISY